MRKFLVKHFVLDYFIGKYHFPRASRIIFPLFMITGYLHIEPDFFSWCMIGVTVVALFFGFVYFRMFPVSRYELDTSQKKQYDNIKKSLNL